MNANNLLIVIPARGGSKGLPGKNAKTLNCQPLLKWTFDAVSLSGLKNYQCILSTDDEKIAAIGRDIGLRVPFIRPPVLATDTANATDVAEHALNWSEQEEDFHPEYIMLLQPTSPFRPPSIIRESYDLLTKNKADAVIGVKAIHRSLGTLFYTDNNKLFPLEQQTSLITRRQDVRTLYTPNGAMYAVKTKVLREKQTFFPENSIPIIMNQVQSHDIDDPIDWKIATAYAAAQLSWRTNNLETAE
jgi:CMP-N,N'-diacetyllegionaminic acid synthase